MSALRFVERVPPPVGSVVNEWQDESGAVLATGYHYGSDHWLRVAQVGTFFYRAVHGRLEIDVEDAGLCPRPRLQEVFERSVLPLALLARGVEVLHASGVAHPRGIVAFCGPSGSGKSTITAALQRRGFRAVADDALVIHGGSGPITIESLPFRLRLDAQARAGVEGLQSRPASEARPTSRNGREDIRAIVLLRRQQGTERARLSQLAPAEAFTALLECAYCFDPRDMERRAEMSRRYLDLAAATPTLELVFEARLSALAASVDLLETRLLTPLLDEVREGRGNPSGGPT